MAPARCHQPASSAPKGASGAPEPGAGLGHSDRPHGGGAPAGNRGGESGVGHVPGARSGAAAADAQGGDDVAADAPIEAPGAAPAPSAARSTVGSMAAPLEGSATPREAPHREQNRAESSLTAPHAEHVNARIPPGSEATCGLGRWCSCAGSEHGDRQHVGPSALSDVAQPYSSNGNAPGTVERESARWGGTHLCTAMPHSLRPVAVEPRDPGAALRSAQRARSAEQP